MNKKRILFASGLALSLAFAGCAKNAPASSSNSETSSTGSSAPLSSSGTSSSSSTNGGTSSIDYGGDITFTGLVKIYYHNDNSSAYPSKRLWVWGDSVDGAEYGFD